MLLHQFRNPLRRLRALTDPVVNALQVELQPTLFASRNGIEIPRLLQGHATLSHAAVSHHNVIEGLLFCPTASKPNRYHRSKPLKTLRNSGPPEGGLPEKG